MFENCWYFFSDADLLDSGHDLPGSEGYWMLLPFGGGYEGEVMEKVHIGIPEMIATYETLTRLHKYIGDPQGHVEKSCFRLIVVLPEAWRFPAWNARVHDIFNDFLSATIDPLCAFGLKTFDNLFHTWSKISACLLASPDQYLMPLPRFPSYLLLIPTLSVLLRPLLAEQAGEAQAGEEGGDDEGEGGGGDDEDGNEGRSDDEE